MKDDIFAIIGAIALIIFAVIISPWIGYWFAYFGGWLAKITIGNNLVESLNLLFNTDYFNIEFLPKMAGALGWIGGFFKGTSSISKNK